VAFERIEQFKWIKNQLTFSILQSRPTAKGVKIGFLQWFPIFLIFKIMKMIYLDCHWIDLFPVIKCCRGVLWRHMNLLYIYLTVVYLAGWNYHSSKLSKNSQNFIFSRKFTLKIHSFFEIYWTKNSFQRDWSHNTTKNSNQILRITTTSDHFWPKITR
jgi:hypothetical protein